MFGRGVRLGAVLWSCCMSVIWWLQESLVADRPHEDLMAEAEKEGFSNCRVLNRHFRLNTQASTSPSPNMPPKAFETPADLAQAAKDYGGDTRREQLSYITQTASAGQKACLREEGLSTSNITPDFRPDCTSEYRAHKHLQMFCRGSPNRTQEKLANLV
ncbi:hypothetical protein PROFUN_10124 [Planoprotostelium fungivorum]|uniref:Uncharacterized protein n=1 Tax=Planoprotostelium fungivorum TaxID=1890364 RepID=A0A2P6NEP0_9EUKA|nr:hypothetical protein PROFUN_10124 [Planoprotostelium fungivorum]